MPWPGLIFLLEKEFLKEEERKVTYKCDFKKLLTMQYPKLILDETDFSHMGYHTICTEEKTLAKRFHKRL